MGFCALGLSSGNEWDWSRGALTFYYGTAAVNAVNPFQNSPDNNGNVLRQMNYVPLSAGGYVMPQIDDYQYDPLNRIQQVSESQQSSAGQVSFLFTQKYAYDRWGNRTIDVPGTTPSIPGGTRKTFVVDAATNRLTSSDGCAMTYDSAGNQTYDCVGTHSYDAENRMTKAVQGSSNNYYFYDASGKRVRRILNGSQTWGGQETWFVYGFEGELAAEYAYNQVTAPLATAPQKEYGYRGGKLLVVWDGTQAGDDQLKWLVTDHLGSTRMEANKSGSLATIRRHDYLPFGEELVASTGAQRGGIGYEPPASSVRQRFGSKERDTETGLDFFEARYFSCVQGRFTSVDPKEIAFEPKDAKYLGYLLNPQNWNRYTYVLNHPLALVDLDGREPNKLQAGTAQQIVAVIQQIERDNPTSSRTEILQKVDAHFRALDDQAGPARYVYTEKSGWIDAKHFFAAANEAQTFGEVLTVLGGYRVEFNQWLAGDPSAGSYEDVGSNYAGADFGDDVFNPNGAPVSEQVSTYFNNTLQARAPGAAPNYNHLPSGPLAPTGSRSNQTTESRTQSTQSTRRSANTQSQSGQRTVTNSTTNSAGRACPRGRCPETSTGRGGSN
ncbi:MAG: hypothetical protein IPL01_24580 [Acidobacteria bacterium]|nr:hypothetical protein [Acidobacteriota bacterium]